MNNEADHRSARGSFLSVILTLLAACFFLFFLFLACGGIAVYVIWVVAGVGLIGLLHYMLWGNAYSQEVEGEREELEIREREEELPDRAGAGEWTPEERSWYRRF